jgi:hypothetical protein
MNHSEQEYIASYRLRIAEKFHFENGNRAPRQRDLEYLADAIEEKSGVRLSLSTLKRIWKENYEQTPHPSTLDALVSVLEHKDWQEYKLNTSLSGPLPSSSEKNKNTMLNLWITVLSLITVAAFIWLIVFRAGKSVSGKPLVNGPIVFTGNKTLSSGVPNTIIFNYDLHKVDADSFFFQQSWNELDKVRLDPKGSFYSNIYYYPGFHKAKLIANDSLLRTFKIHITTAGWLALTRNSLDDNHPVYISNHRPITNGALHVTRRDLGLSKLNPTADFILSYFNVREFENTFSDNFSLETNIKCDSISATPCPEFLLTIICEEGRFAVSVVKKGCERNVGIKIGEVYQEGINNNLSAFGRNVYTWQHIKIKVANKYATIYIDDQPVYSSSFKNDFGKVMGLVFNFSGTGAIDFVRLRNGSDRLVYEDNFDK